MRGSVAVMKPERRAAWGSDQVRQPEVTRDEVQQIQATREDRIKAVITVLAQQDLSRRPLIGAGRLAHDIARGLAESIVDAVVTADEREIQRSFKGPSPR